LFWRAIEKYGWDNFDHEVVAANLTLEEANHFEELLIEQLCTMNPKCGYNLRSGGENNYLSEETKKKIGEANSGHIMPEEQKQKLREMHIGTHLSDEHKQKISEALKGENNPNYGKKMSDEQKRKVSETMKRKIMEGSIIVPYKRNHSSKISYPEKYFMEVFKDLPVKYNYQVGLYQLDFAIPERMVYIEIDGEQHFCDKRIVEHDKERTQKLESLGWFCLRRVRWSEYKKLNQEQQKQYCNELIQLLSK
jgi:group I intron endonuclease